MHPWQLKNGLAPGKAGSQILYGKKLSKSIKDVVKKCFPNDIDYGDDYYDTYAGSVFHFSFEADKEERIMVLVMRIGGLIMYCEELEPETKIETLIKDYLHEILRKALVVIAEKEGYKSYENAMDFVSDLYPRCLKPAAKRWVDNYISEFRYKKFRSKKQFITFREIINQTYFFKYTNVDSMIERGRLEPRYKQEWCLIRE